MINGSINGMGGIDAALRRIKNLAAVDLGPLAQAVARIIVEGNEAGLLAGTDADGKSFAPLAESTLRTRRGGFGPPTIPRFGASGLIDRFRARVDVTPGGFKITAGWNNQVEQVRYFNSGTRHMPARRVSGIRPETRIKIQEAVDKFVRRVVASQ